MYKGLGTKDKERTRREEPRREGKGMNKAIRNLFNYLRKYLKQADHHKPFTRCFPFKVLLFEE
jgi:hypothetical protein